MASDLLITNQGQGQTQSTSENLSDTTDNDLDEPYLLDDALGGHAWLVSLILGEESRFFGPQPRELRSGAGTKRVNPLRPPTSATFADVEHSPAGPVGICIHRPDLSEHCHQYSRTIGAPLIAIRPLDPS
jgi:hypothetical protein